MLQSETYDIYTNGSLSNANNYYSISASGGTQLGNITLNSINTTYGDVEMMNQGGRGDAPMGEWKTIINKTGSFQWK